MEDSIQINLSVEFAKSIYLLFFQLHHESLTLQNKIQFNGYNCEIWSQSLWWRFTRDVTIIIHEKNESVYWATRRSASVYLHDIRPINVQFSIVQIFGHLADDRNMPTNLQTSSDDRSEIDAPYQRILSTSSAKYNFRNPSPQQTWTLSPTILLSGRHRLFHTECPHEILIQRPSRPISSGHIIHTVRLSVPTLY